ncbi:MAG: dihydroorotate dehydrogenase [Chloroflexota bacterium]
MDLTVDLAPRHPGGLLLQNPVMTSSGTFGYGTEYADVVDIRRLGAIVTKGVTLRPRRGNPQPRLVETEAGVLNSVGLENIGVDEVVRDKAPVWATWATPVVVNVAGETCDEYVEVARKLEGIRGISALELNVSCPNVSSGGIEFGLYAEPAAKLTSAVKQATGLPLMVKLTPNACDLVAVAVAVEEAGADALCLINTVQGMAINVDTRRPALGNVVGGLSGSAIRPVAVYAVYRVAQAVRIPIVGCGGIFVARDALEFLFAGASGVEVGTATMADPNACLKVVSGLEDYMRENRVRHITELVGCALPAA